MLVEAAKVQNSSDNTSQNRNDPASLDVPYDVHLEFFSGPMDLLLHLVSMKELSIAEVSMTEVLDQYLEIVTKQAHTIDLEKASEYLVIAATLMVIKSKALLPPEPESLEESDEEDEYSRFFENLRERLKAFELTKARASALIETPQLGVDTFTRSNKNAITIPPEMLAEGETSDRLGALFLNLVKRVGGLSRKLLISIEPVSIVSSMMKLVDTLKASSESGFMSFYKLLSGNNKSADKITVRNNILGNFIAILELAKRGVISVSQPYQTRDIQVRLKIDSSETEFESEFDKIEQNEDDKDQNSNVIPFDKTKNSNDLRNDNISDNMENDLKEGVSNG